MTVRWTMLAAPLFFAGAAFSAMIQTAVDLDPNTLVPGPNSSALETSFRATLTTPRTIDFESLAPQFTTNFSPLSGVTVTLQNVTPVFDTISTDSNAFNGFNTTPGGSNILQLESETDTPDVYAKFQFATPVTAFGFFLTGAGTQFGNTFVEFTDGDGLHLVPLTTSNQYPDSSVIYVAINGLNGSTGYFTFWISPDLDDMMDLVIRDIVALDDITFQEDPSAVPEPSAILLTAAGGMALLLRRRRA